MDSPDATTTPPLPEGYRVRRPGRDDFDAVVALVAAADIALLGESDSDPSDISRLWALPRFSLARDAWLAESADGRLAAYAWSFNEEPEGPPHGFFALAPDHRRAALGAHLLALAEERGAELLSAARWGEPTFGVWRPEKDALKRQLYESAGYAQTRIFEQMRIAAGDVHDAEVPEGLELRGLRRPDDERAVHACIEEAFSEHFRYAPVPLEEFWIEYAGAEGPIWTVAWDGDEVAGAAMGFSMQHYGYVDMLAVRRGWRGRGLGLALLVDVLGRLRDRGHQQLVLGVDATNTTGAERLYRRAGMHVSRRTFFYEKPLV